jgi:YidC/Oxa1 family membrane protein insertase
LSNESTRGLIDTYNNFLGLNIGDSPQTLIVQAFHNGAWTVLIGALMIPILSAVTQWITVKLMPQQNSNSKNMDDTTAQMQSTMKSMNTVMPRLSAWFCLSLPAGMGIYWVAGSIVRGIQQVVINKHIDKMDVNEVIEKNKEKSAKKIKKMKENQEKINAYANMSTKNINQKANLSSDQSSGVPSQPKMAKAGSMMAKANMVSDYNKKSGKK